MGRSTQWLRRTHKKWVEKATATANNTLSSECINFLKKNSIKNIIKKIDDKKFNLSSNSKYYLKELYDKYYPNKNKK